MRFLLEGGLILDTDKAIGRWLEAEQCDGRGDFVGISSGDPLIHHVLYRSSKGRYYMVTTYDYLEEEGPKCELLTPEEAVLWLLLNQHSIPEDLKEFEDRLTE